MRESSLRSCPKLALALVAAMVVAFPILADDKAPPKQPIEYFALTEEGLEGFGKAMKNLEKNAAAIRAELEALEKKQKEEENDGSVDAVIATMTKACEGVAGFRSAVKDAGLSCRDYTLLSVTTMQASILALGYQARGEEFLESFPGGKEGHVRANIEFAIAHKADLETLAAHQGKLFEKK